MTNEPLNAQTGDNHHYNCSDDADRVRPSGAAKIDVIIPAGLSEFDTGAARALLHLLVEAHRKRTTHDEQSAEDT